MERDVLTVMRLRRLAKVERYLAKHPNSTRRQIAIGLGIPTSTIGDHLMSLRELGRVQAKPVLLPGGVRTYEFRVRQHLPPLRTDKPLRLDRPPPPPRDLGPARREELVAALFGPAKPRATDGEG